ncbi:hypothetical protein NUM3379_01430 [Kineococcus sp. NUM-3379]
MRLRSAAMAASVILASLIAPVTAADPAQAATKPRLDVVILGDSYSAGNGAGRYGGPLLCYRSENNWGNQYARSLADRYTVNVVNRACSGGVIADITQRRKMETRPVPIPVPGPLATKDDPRARALLNASRLCTPRYDEEFEITPLTAVAGPAAGVTTVTFACTRYIQPQIDAINEGTDLVLFSMGGNDIGFAEIVEQCFVLGARDVDTCESSVQTARADVATKVGDRLAAALPTIKKKMRGDAKIVLKSYPHLERDPNYTLRNLRRTTSFAVGKEVRALGDEGNTAQRRAVDAANADPSGPRVIYVPEVKPEFAGKEPDGRVCCENPDRWVAEFDDLDMHMWYHYNERGHQEIARILRGKSDFGLGGTGDGRTNGTIDIAFVVDTTGSMGSAINSVKAAATSLVNQVAARTDSARFSLVDYRDFASRTGSPQDYPSTLRQDFTSDPSAINTAIQGLDLGYGGDTPETMYSGLNTAFDLTWRPGAKKMAVVLADAPPLSPEPSTGHTGAQVIARSLAIDPVETHFIDISGYTSGHAEIADIAARTNGGIYRSVPAQAADEIAEAIDVSLDRPFAWAAGPYVTTIGEPVTLDGSGSVGIGTEIAKYEWDVNGDGVYDHTATTPTATHTWTSDFDGLIALRVTDTAGRVGLATTIGHASIDGDEIPPAFDNCPSTANHSQADFDADGLGDECDPTNGRPTQDKPGVVDGVADPDGDSTPGTVTTFRKPHFNTSSTIATVDDFADYSGVQHPGGTLQVQLIGLPADYDLLVTDTAGKVLGRSETAGTADEKIRVTTAAGRYLIAVVPKSGQFSATPYRLNVTVVARGGN